MAFKKSSIRSDLNRSLAKTLAFMENGNIDSARQWASILQQKLIDLKLLIDTDQRGAHNGPHSESTDNTQKKAPTR